MHYVKMLLRISLSGKIHHRADLHQFKVLPLAHKSLEAEAALLEADEALVADHDVVE